MEITTPVGFHIASITLKDDLFTLIVPSKKLHRRGLPNPHAFEDVIPLSLDPRWVIPILFDQPLPKWVCQRDENGQLETCQIDAFSIAWTKRRGYQKTLKIASDRFEAMIYIKSFQPYLPKNIDLFTLPEVFQVKVLEQE